MMNGIGIANRGMSAANDASAGFHVGITAGVGSEMGARSARGIPSRHDDAFGSRQERRHEEHRAERHLTKAISTLLQHGMGMLGGLMKSMTGMFGGLGSMGGGFGAMGAGIGKFFGG